MAEPIGVDASTMEANAALRNIVRRDTGEGYRGMLERLAQESGIETRKRLIARLDRKRNWQEALGLEDWVSRMRPPRPRSPRGRTVGHASGLRARGGSGTIAVVAAELHPADEG